MSQPSIPDSLGSGRPGSPELQCPEQVLLPTIAIPMVVVVVLVLVLVVLVLVMVVVVWW